MTREVAMEGQGKSAPSICVFDVNETLLDIEYIGPLFQRLFGERKVLREWFGQLVLYSHVITISGSYVSFFDLGQGVLRMLAETYHIGIKEADVEELRARMLTMPAHADVPPGLKLLQDAGFRLVTLTNSPPVPGPSPLHNARLGGWFEKSFSVDQVRRFKPAPEVYQLVADEMGVSPSQICMVAAHVWDTIGAQSVGCSGALIARPGNAPLRVKGVPEPQIVGSTLPEMAAQAVALWR
jgi:2-haloacid dehalogenase